ncbi:hypothetical protein KQI65_14260 [bacterium]|nr:hypothetical protein [bacterium]
MNPIGTACFRRADRTILCVVLSLLLCSSLSAQSLKEWTVNADFDEGLLINVNHDVVADQLQLNHESALLPYVNVAASDRGTVIRIDANTGKILGEYRTTPQGALHNPSRTTVDRAGNVWAANRDQPVPAGTGMGSVVKIGVVLGGTRCDRNGLPVASGEYLKPPFLYCSAVDRDGDGLIRTSRGLGDIKSWDGDGVEDAEDECILLYEKIPARNCRHISIDADNNVWVGGYSMQNITLSTMMKLDGHTGDVLMLKEQLKCGGYGGLVSANGTIFSSSLNGGSGPMLMMSSSGDTTCIDAVESYGIAEAPDGSIWASSYEKALLFKLDPTGAILPGYPIALNGTLVRGVAVTPDDSHVWIACTGTNTVERRDADGALIKEFDLASNGTPGEFPTGVAVDYNGKVWITCANTNNVFRIDPAGDAGKGLIDMVVDLGFGARPYNYSDMTGAAYGEYYALYGTWSVLHDGGADGLLWQRVRWNASEPSDSRILVKARASDSREDLLDEEYRYLENGTLNCDSALSGRYIQMIVEFFRGSSTTNNPVLYDIELAGTPRPIVETVSNVICKGDSVRIQADPRFTQIRWNDGKGGTVRFITEGGTYWYEARTSLGCYILSDSMQIDLHERPTPHVEASALIKCTGEPVELRVSEAYEHYRWEPALPHDTLRTLLVTVPGTYRVEVIDSNGCSGLSPAIGISDYPASVLKLEALGDTVICSSEDDVTLRATPGYAQYFWSTGDSSKGNLLSVTDSGRYTVVAYDANGCRVVSNAITVRRSPTPFLELILDGPAEHCEGEEVMLHATPGFVNYRWSTGANGEIPSIPGGDSGDYWVVATDSNGCRITSDTIRLTVHAGPDIKLRAVGDSVLCGEGILRLEATPGYTEYEWNTGQLSPDPWLDVTLPGLYQVSVRDSMGCVGKSNPVNIVIHEKPSVDIWLDGGLVLCRGSVSMLNATPGFDIYRWSTGLEGPMSNIAITDSGRFWVEVENEIGCRAMSDTVVVRIGDELAPQIRPPSDTLCPGGSVSLDAGGGYARYEWSTGDTTRIIEVTKPGIYHITVYSDNGCSGDTTVPIYAELPVLISGSTDTLCRGDARELDAGAGYASYSWSTGEQTRRITVTDSGSYVATVTTSRGCVLHDTIRVYTYPLRPLVFDGPRSVCPGEEVRYHVGGDSLSSVDWILPAGGEILQGAGTADVLVRWNEVGTHELTAQTRLFPSGCPHDSSIQVLVETVIAPSIAGETQLCSGENTWLSVGPHQSGSLWILPDGRRVSGTDSIETGQLGLHRFVATNTSGCADTSSIIVTPLAAPDAFIIGETAFCEGESTSLTAAGTYASHRWITADGSSTDDTLRRNRAGSVVLETRGANGCTARDSVMLTIYPAPLPVITGDTLLVYGGTTELCLDRNWQQIRWTLPDGSGIADKQCITVADTGVYQALVFDSLGCPGTVTHLLRMEPAEARAVVGLPTLRAEPGERIMISIDLLEAQQLAGLPLTGWSAELEIDGRVLIPWGATAEGRMEGDMRIVPVSGPAAGSPQRLLTLEFLVLLGPVDSTSLSLHAYTWEGAPVRTDLIDGAVLVEICTEGGDRLFDASGTIRLEANRPNPFNSSTVITFEIIEAGNTEVVVMDDVGRVVRTLQQGSLQPGVYSLLFDAHGLSSGLYYCVLRTPTQRRVQRMQLIK